MILRFATWNVNYRNFKREHLEFIKSVDPDVLALQEVSVKFHQGLKTSRFFNWSRSSAELVRSHSYRPKAHRLTCSIFGKELVFPESASTVTSLHFPERSLVVEGQTPVGPVTFCSFHIPPGASWKLIKPITMGELATYLSKLPNTAIVGMDANAPKTDHPDHSKNTWWWDGEERLLGATPDHHLKDALRLFISDNPQHQRESVTAGENGPLAVSYKRGRNECRTDCRYDFILITPDIRVLKIAYLYNEALAAGSDHALVVADLEIVP